MARFSVIMPVLNGGEYIKESIKSILEQTFADFELHVLDSCSTDGTVNWLYSLTDPRIVVHASDKPLTIEQNWGRIKTIPRNEFMFIIGHDDIVHPHYLQIISSLIDEYPDAALYGTHFDFIDGNGVVTKAIDSMQFKYSSQEFIEKLIPSEIGVVSMVMRSADYDKTGGVPDFPSFLYGDFPFFINLACLGKYVIMSPENGISYRLHTSSTTGSSKFELYFNAFEHYVNYLHGLKSVSTELQQIVSRAARPLLRSKGAEFASKLLHTPKPNRTFYKTVDELIEKHRQYTNLLIDNNDYDPENERSLKIARLLDKTLFGRKLFIMIKKIFKGPILKKK
jgi:glycosyltransferase involved in cell wall biosynthesis